MPPRLLSNSTRSRWTSQHYWHHASELLSRIYCTSDISRILAEGIYHYTMLYGLNSKRLKDSVVGHYSLQWKTMEEYVRHIWNIGVSYEKTKGYFSTEFNTQEASSITQVNTMKKLGLCYKHGGLNLQANGINQKGNNRNKFQNKKPA